MTIITRPEIAALLIATATAAGLMVSEIYCSRTTKDQSDKVWGNVVRSRAADATRQTTSFFENAAGNSFDTRKVNNK